MFIVALGSTAHLRFGGLRRYKKVGSEKSLYLGLQRVAALQRKRKMLEVFSVDFHITFAVPVSCAQSYLIYRATMPWLQHVKVKAAFYQQLASNDGALLLSRL